MNARVQWRRVAPYPPDLPPIKLEPATYGSAGLDLVAAEPVYLAHGVPFPVRTGVAVWLRDPALVGLVTLRSGFALRSGCVMPNSPGIIDSDYQGEIKVPLMAVHQPVKLELGQRFAQLVIVPRPLVELELVREFSAPTDRGEGGFGSTGA